MRHGLTRWNSQQRFCGHSDIALSSQGRSQARWLARQLRSAPIGVIYSSDLLRARETAEIIAAEHAVPLKLSAAWREIHFGAWEGLTYAQISERFVEQTAFFTDPLRYAPPGGETLASLWQRVHSGVQEIMLSDIAASAEQEAAGQSDVLIVSHGGPLRLLLCYALGLALEQQWRWRIDPGSLSALDVLVGGEGTSFQAILSLLDMQRPRRKASAI
ncbi:histidine phosphatase family protein [Ktedonosporobacter rubrisoli]|uniref:histidine phosphatase family protein n=1 Tax=Ktedonosporobacter rubrisoli TaxID=2509675 RepID=UPI0013EE73FD|nr:histidine phosphatase family protein [Ktedonosporobacter rubrisoli]